MHLYEAETCDKYQIPGGQVLNVIVVSNLRIQTGKYENKVEESRFV